MVYMKSCYCVILSNFFLWIDKRTKYNVEELYPLSSKNENHVEE